MVLIILGSNGDLASTKIYPALNKLNLNEKIILYCRKSSEESLKKKIRENPNMFSNIKDNIQIVSGDYTDLSSLKNHLENPIFYLSIPPFLYLNVLQEIIKYGGGVVCIEKPYGENCADFEKMYELMQKEKNLNCIFIDHFITKFLPIEAQTLVNEGNFKKVLNNEYIEYCEIAIKENISANKRKYFDQTGTLKDMLVNHLIQYLVTFSGAKGQLLNSLEKTSIDDKHCMFGQYCGYKEEMENENTQTETFALVVAKIETERWQNTPFIMYSGKLMNEKNYKIIFKIKKEKMGDFLEIFGEKENEMSKKVYLIFDILSEEIFLQIDDKKKLIFDKKNIKRVYKYYDYEGIFYALCNGNFDFPYVFSEEIRHFWRIFKNIDTKKFEMFFYKHGHDFKKEIDSLKDNLRKDK